MSVAVPRYQTLYRDHLPIPGINDDRYAGVRSLWLKVIIRAMFDLASYRDSDKLSQRKLAENAYNWLFGPSEIYNSFENVCRLLDLDPKRIRNRANLMTKDDVAKIEFKERRGLEVLDSPEPEPVDTSMDDDWES